MIKTETDIENERVIDRLFHDLEQSGIKAIALSNDEEVRIHLLGMMQMMSTYKLRLYNALKSKSVDTVLISPGQELTEELMSELGPQTQIIKLDDDTAESMEL